MNVRFNGEELNEVRCAINARRTELDKCRTSLEKAGLSTFVADAQIEILDRVKVAIGDEPSDMFSGVDKATGEILDD